MKSFLLKRSSLDFQEIFGEFWARKVFLKDAPFYKFSILDPAQKAALKKLPVLDLEDLEDLEDPSQLETDLEGFQDSDAALALGASISGFQFYVVRFQDRIWVVDTGGFNYARYLFGLKDVPPEALHN
jgi:hypothetical protein